MMQRYSVLMSLIVLGTSACVYGAEHHSKQECTHKTLKVVNACYAGVDRYNGKEAHICSLGKGTWHLYDKLWVYDNVTAKLDDLTVIKGLHMCHPSAHAVLSIKEVLSTGDATLLTPEERVAHSRVAVRICVGSASSSSSSSSSKDL